MGTENAVSGKVSMGTLTLKDGTKLPIEQLIDDDGPVFQEDEQVRQSEERRFSRCLRRRLVDKVWDDERAVGQAGPPLLYDKYRLATENLKRKEIAMNKDNDKIYETKAFSLFEAFFKNPKLWLNSRRLHELTGVDISGITTLLRRPLPFLIAEGMLQEKEDPAVRGHQWMFIAQCDDPKEEARIWYRRMLEATSGVKRPPKLGSKLVQRKVVSLPSSETVATALRELKVGGGNGMVNMQIDTTTMEAIVRVPLAALPKVIEALR